MQEFRRSNWKYELTCCKVTVLPVTWIEFMTSDAPFKGQASRTDIVRLWNDLVIKIKTNVTDTISNGYQQLSRGITCVYSSGKMSTFLVTQNGQLIR